MKAGYVCTGIGCESKDTCMHYEPNPSPYQAKVDPEDVMVDDVCKSYLEVKDEIN